MNYPKSWDLVKKDIDDRDAYGIKTYGVPLKPFMNREKKNLRDVYEEGLDFIVYLRTLIFEWNHLSSKIRGLMVLEDIDQIRLGLKEICDKLDLD